ncbi:MAG: glycogen/starch/alpha-glucan phosphorylase [Hyphomicrobiaceae bacterium]|nr:glycogen/starch/alpha-glucan phosphorylase [Hyphomicrobiaceae bacterium]
MALHSTARQNDLQVDALRADLLAQLRQNVGVSQQDATLRDWLQATALTVRARLVDRWHDSNKELRSRGAKQVSYLSMEFLLSRQLQNALMALDLYPDLLQVLSDLDVPADKIFELESEPALGNGGLGRLAACFMDSMASTGVPAYGYGIYYEYGMFRQEFSDGWQVEQPEEWLVGPNPWEFSRADPVYEIGFGGTVEHRDTRAIWRPGESVIAVAHDMLVPGHGSSTVNTLRLWAAKPVRGFDIATFNKGNYLEALAPKIRSKTVSRLLYPDDSTEEGRELRLRQEHFFASASIQDMLSRFVRDNGTDWNKLPDKVALHLNDTHPALAPVELMRLLVDQHLLEWEDAWQLTTQVFSYTNHTLMPEALESWRVDLLRRVAPRHLEIVEEINRRLVRAVNAESATIAVEKVAIVSGDQLPSVNMGRLSAYVSHKVNGVSALHSGLVRDTLFPEFANLYPERFQNVTNGISPRLWLFQTNPALAALIDETIGSGWRKTFDLSAFASAAGDPRRRAAFAQIKTANKRQAAAMIEARTGLKVDPTAMFDVQIKRIHEYKRQLLNILGVAARWNAIKTDPEGNWAPRVVLMAGKAASGYWFAKLIIKLAHDVARTINADAETRGKLMFVYLPNYNVSLAERIIPAADLSQQISLAGTEASGTGNMKLALNGALTLGTADGANIEIADAVGGENIFTFGLRVDDVAELKRSGAYSPLDTSNAQPQLRQVLEQIAGGYFSPDDPHRFQPIIDALLSHGDRYMVIADFEDYWRAQRDVDALWLDPDGWTRKAMLNVAQMGMFTSDRSIREYAQKIWAT